MFNNIMINKYNIIQNQAWVPCSFLVLMKGKIVRYFSLTKSSKYKTSVFQLDCSTLNESFH